MERLRLRPALLEGVLARLGLAVQLVLALFMILLVAPDLAALLHLGAAEGGQERDERGEAAHHVWGARSTRLAPLRRAVGVTTGLPTTLLVVRAPVPVVVALLLCAFTSAPPLASLGLPLGLPLRALFTFLELSSGM